VLSLALQSLMLGAYLGLFNRSALTGSVKVWRSSLFAGFLGAFASQFWFIGFSLTSAANIRTLALVEVIFALGVSRYLLRQPVSARQLTGMVVIVAGIALLLRLQA
jgi:drug/metabolite transporter (DMT)-like permease